MPRRPPAAPHLLETGEDAAGRGRSRPPDHSLLSLILIGGTLYLPTRVAIGAGFKLWRCLPILERLVGPGPGMPSSTSIIVDEHHGARRVAFVWGGLLDNWAGLAWDPTGRILEVNDLDVSLSSDLPEDSPMFFFGGDIVYAQHLWGPWYYVAAT